MVIRFRVLYIVMSLVSGISSVHRIEADYLKSWISREVKVWYFNCTFHSQGIGHRENILPSYHESGDVK